MTKKLLIRKIHRYLALIVGLQLLFWSLGGLFFSIIPISEIHGNHLKAEKVGTDWSRAQAVKSMAEIYAEIENQGFRIEDIAKANLEPIDGVFYYHIELTKNRNLWINGLSGKAKPRYSDADIAKIASAKANNAGNVVEVKWITQTGKDSEYRGKPLPAYRVVFDGSDNLHMYLDGYTGKINSMRTSNWRIFDFFWMLHVMDYQTRDSFNHWLLQLFAFLAVITSLSGIVLWVVSYRRSARAA